jgi:hypothetical protein
VALVTCITALGKRCSFPPAPHLPPLLRHSPHVRARMRPSSSRASPPRRTRAQRPGRELARQLANHCARRVVLQHCRTRCGRSLLRGLYDRGCACPIHVRRIDGDRPVDRHDRRCKRYRGIFSTLTTHSLRSSTLGSSTTVSENAARMELRPDQAGLPRAGARSLREGPKQPPRREGRAFDAARQVNNVQPLSDLILPHRRLLSLSLRGRP